MELKQLGAEVESSYFENVSLVFVLPWVKNIVSSIYLIFIQIDNHHLGLGAHSQAGWFRKHYTSIDTVQKIYGTHPRFNSSRRRPATTRLSQARVRPSSVGHARTRCNTSLAHTACQVKWADYHESEVSQIQPTLIKESCKLWKL